MSNPQYTLTIALGVGDEGIKCRERYITAAEGRPLSQWVRETLDEAIRRSKELTEKKQ